MNNKNIQLVAIMLFLSCMLSACASDYAYGPNAPKEKQEEMWGGVGKNAPVRVIPNP